MAKKTKHYSIVERVKILLWSSRPVSWINTAFPFAAGYLFLRGTQVDTAFWVALVFFLIPYNMLIYVVNDIYDYESDMQNPRKGGVEGAVLDKQLHPFMFVATVLACLPFAIYLAITGTVASDIILLICLLDALAYSVPPVRLKERPVLDSMSSSLHFVAPLLYALSLFNWPSAAWPYVIAFFVWGMASHAFGAVQDIIPDRKAGLASVATYFGAQKTVWASLILYILAVVLVAWQEWPALIVALAGLAYPIIVAPYRTITDAMSAQSNGGWKHFMKVNQLLGFSITILLILHIT